MNNLPDYNIITISNDIDNSEYNNDTYALFKIDDIISNNIRLYGSYQSNLIKVSLKYLYDKTKNVLDIGANIGTFTIPIAKRIQGTVYSFEIQRHIFMQLCTNCFLNNLANVYPIHGLICDQETVSQSKFTKIDIVNFNDSKNIGAFTINNTFNSVNNNMPPKHKDILDQVQNICIDNLNIQNIGFIKIDVEGSELSVLKGMKNTIISNNYPPILFEYFTYIREYNDMNIALTDFIKSLNYTIYNIENETDNYIAFHKDFIII